MKAHTPSDWNPTSAVSTHNRPTYFWEATIISGDRIPIADVVGRTQEEAEGRARLIAAAPELLEAVQSARSYMSHTDWCNETTNGVDGDCECGHALAIERVNAVIVKATGAT